MGAAIFAALFGLFGYLLIQHYTKARENDLAFDRIRVLLQTGSRETDSGTAPIPALTSRETESSEDSGGGETGVTTSENVPESDRPSAYDVYADVYAQNPDFVGWIRIEGTDIDYPVMQSPDRPNYYLKHGFDQTYSDYGVPFVQENCDIDRSNNLTIYGHHMKDGSMFADLCKYESEAFFEEHRTVRFDTLREFGRYEIIAVFKTVAYSASGFRYYGFVNADCKEDFDAYLAACKRLGLYDIEEGAEYGDRLITLSTCEYSRKNGRMVVVAKRISEADEHG